MTKDQRKRVKKRSAQAKERAKTTRHIKDYEFGRDVSTTMNDDRWQEGRVFITPSSGEWTEAFIKRVEETGDNSYEIIEFKNSDEFRTWAQKKLNTDETSLCELGETLANKFGLVAWDGIGKIAALRNTYLQNPYMSIFVEQLENNYGSEIGYCTELFDPSGKRIIATQEELDKSLNCNIHRKGKHKISRFYPSMQMEVK